MYRIAGNAANERRRGRRLRREGEGGAGRDVREGRRVIAIVCWILVPSEKSTLFIHYGFQGYRYPGSLLFQGDQGFHARNARNYDLTCHDLRYRRRFDLGIRVTPSFCLRQILPKKHNHPQNAQNAHRTVHLKPRAAPLHYQYTPHCPKACGYSNCSLVARFYLAPGYFGYFARVLVPTLARCWHTCSNTDLARC